MSMPIDLTRRALDVKRRHERDLLRKANVVGVGVGFVRRGEEPARQVGLVVSVSCKLPAAALAPEDLVPRTLEGVPVDVVETGTIHAQS